jgi:hypothetical protein
MKCKCLSYSLALLLGLAIPVLALDASQPSQNDRQARRAAKQGQQGQPGPRPRSEVPSDVAAMAKLSLILGRPTDKSVTLSILSSDAREGYVEYGTAPGRYSRKTPMLTLKANEPLEVLLDGLAPDSQCFYRLSTRASGQAAFVPDKEHSFHTQRHPGSTFAFEIQGDSHPERPRKFDPQLYAQTLSAAASDKPDFYMTIGDDFSVDNLRNVNLDSVSAQYLNQRHYLALIGESSPIFLVNGNHEQAAMCNLDGTPNNVAVWAGNSRNRYFPQPATDGFYTGDTQKVEHMGLLRDYYAWTWGDALFVVIDPYWHSPKPVDNVFGGGQKSRDSWATTLGNEQYQWLKHTLETSKAKYKFVFTHHVLGTGRGGIEEAGLFEWGGKDRSGVDGFASHRPGWEMPIHQLMVKTGVTIFFQGHDHIFARQELDGVIYQTLPQPADLSGILDFPDAYTSGDVYPNPGRVRVTVSPQDVKVEYVRLPGNQVIFSYVTDNKAAKGQK